MDKFISPLIPQQFPDFYREQGPNFIAFVQAYYEWLEQTNISDVYSGTLGKSRSIFDYGDIDKTEQAFITHFQNEYVANLPQNAVVNKQLLIKHILDLYRSKGSRSSYDLLFRLMYNESIDLYIPGDYIFRPSDNNWIVPKYIEVNDSPYLVNLINQPISNISGTASAIVESVSSKIVSGKTINIIYISSLDGEFKFGDKIISPSVPQITVQNAPTVIGSLTAISVENGGFNFSVGEILNVNGSGTSAKARVAATTNQNGKVSFNLVNGGYGYTLTNTNITILPTLNLLYNSTAGSFNVGDIVTDSTSTANGTITKANSSFIEVINYSSGISFGAGHSITNSNGATGVLNSILGGTGSGASFTIGNIVNPAVYPISSDLISAHYNTTLENLASGFNLYISSSTGSFTISGGVTSSANVVLLEGRYLSTNSVASGESFSNTSLGLSNLYVFKSDGSQVWITGPDTNITSTNLVSGISLVSNVSSSVLQISNVNPKQTFTGSGTITSANSSLIQINNTSGYFVSTGTLIDTTTSHSAVMSNVVRETNWIFPGNLSNTNLDTIISTALTSYNVQAGTIQSLANINPGSGYSTNPFISLVEPSIAALQISDGYGGIYGSDALVTDLVSNATGIVTAVQVVDSGFGYNPNESVTMSSSNSNIVASGVSMVSRNGIGTGSWDSAKSFLSDTMKIQDSSYYQTFSYEIIAQRMFDTYQNLVRNFVHPSGMALYGRYRFQDQQEPNTSSVSSMTLTQTT